MLTEKTRIFYEFLKDASYKAARRDLDMNANDVVKGESPCMADARMLEFMLNAEEPFVDTIDDFGFRRSIISTPFLTREDGTRYHVGGSGNLVADYAYALENGFLKIIRDINDLRNVNAIGRDSGFYDAAILCLRAGLGFAARYRNAARDCGNTELFEALCRVPGEPPRSFYEALVFMKFMQFMFRCNRNVHATYGRFDQYMYFYYKEDIRKGISKEQLQEELECFFISISLDTDLYPGVQQGDNGQSMVLGGYDERGNDCYNELSEAIMNASLELCLIEPKINLRVSKKTPFDRLLFATKLTKKGLGFPQYCNDDIVIPGLMKLGYSKEDAHDYAVAACWEYICSGKGADVPNIGTMNFPLAVEKATREYLEQSADFDEFLIRVKASIKDCLDDIIMNCSRSIPCPSPFLSVFVDGCLEKGKDISECGARYNNFGIHGAGISTAADSLAAIKKAVFEEKFCTSQELLDALNDNFEGHEVLRNYLLQCPKMGNNDDYVDAIAAVLMQIFSDYMNNRPNGRGGVYRAGTGSAMEYILSAREVGATADGRYASSPYGSSFSPSIIARIIGPLSCIQSFTKFDMTDIINGGPLTMEIHSNVFRNDEGEQKVAMLVKAFIDLGGHQLQLNSVNREILLDAQKHPENHKNLIVRVWGWSGYFNELDKEYQNHIIARTEYVV